LHVAGLNCQKTRFEVAILKLHAQRSRNCQQAWVARATGGAICALGESVQEHNHDLERPGEVLGRQPTGSAFCQFGLRRPYHPRAVGPDEQEALNKLEALLLSFAMKKVGLKETEARRED
jgi:hypothetical protein